MRSSSNPKNDGCQTEINPRLPAATRCRAVASAHESMSGIRATVAGTAIIRRSAKRCSGPKYAVSSSSPIGMPPGVRSACRVAGEIDQ